MRLRNPTEYGKSEIVVIKSFNSSGVQIDENDEDVFVDVLDITGPSEYTVEFTVGPPLDFKLNVTP